MPASAFSSYFAWGIYLITAFAIVVVCSPVLNGVRNYAFGDAAAETAEGAARVFDGLSPGVTTVFSFHSPSPDGRIELHGRSITVVWGGISSTRGAYWLLPNKTLSPELRYSISLAGDHVEVIDPVRV